jgi:Asp-tRNA(Asn)/Glu-tRNA(Gln) amidotransferase C subunit
MTPSDWIKEVHGLARSNGWWGEVPDKSPKSVMAKIALVVSELMEALELVREPGFDPVAVWATGAEGVRVPYAELAAKASKLPKPEGFGTELADAVIRIFDLCGGCGFDLGLKDDIFEKTKLKHLEKLGRPRVDLDADEVLQSIMRVVLQLSKAAEEVDTDQLDPKYHPHRISTIEGWLTAAVLTTTVLASVMGSDIEARIAEKHAYNKTRPPRHGGKRA